MIDAAFCTVSDSILAHICLLCVCAVVKAEKDERQCKLIWRGLPPLSSSNQMCKAEIEEQRGQEESERGLMQVSYMFNQT